MWSIRYGVVVHWRWVLLRTHPRFSQQKKIITINSHSHNTSNPASQQQHVSRNVNLLDFSAYRNSYCSTTQFPFIFTIFTLLLALSFSVSYRMALNNWTSSLPDWNTMVRLLLHKIQIQIIELGCCILSLFYFCTHTPYMHTRYIALVFISIKQEQKLMCVCNACNMAKYIFCEFY